MAQFLGTKLSFEEKKSILKFLAQAAKKMHYHVDVKKEEETNLKYKVYYVSIPSLDLDIELYSPLKEFISYGMSDNDGEFWIHSSTHPTYRTIKRITDLFGISPEIDEVICAKLR